MTGKAVIMDFHRAHAVGSLQQMLKKLDAMPKAGHIVITLKFSMSNETRLVYWTDEPWYEDEGFEWVTG